MQVHLEVIDEVVVVHLKGRLSYESASRFRAHCLSQLRSEKVVFNLSGLNFVGSSGIHAFLETMTELSVDDNSTVKFSGVGPEFQKIFQNSRLKDVEIYENHNKAQASFKYPSITSGPRLPKYFLGKG